MEGVSSNVFALIDGEVYTAEEGVLHGSVRDTVLAACRENGVTVHLTPPPGGARGVAEGWEGALISSTSRLAIPLDAILVPRAATEPLQSTRQHVGRASIHNTHSQSSLRAFEN